MVKHYDQELKAKVVSALLLGATPEEVVKEHPEIRKETIDQWQREIREQKPSGKVGKALNENKKAFGDLITDYLSESFTTFATLQEHFRDKDWLSRQSANHLAVLFGVSVDKALRILAAAERAGFGSENSDAE